MTYNNCLDEGIKLLQGNNINDYEYDAFALLEYVTGINRSDFFLKKSDTISDSDYKRYISLIERRANREPLQHITNIQNFYGYNFFVNSDVLVPRQDTEVLIEKTIEMIEENFDSNSSSCIRILDMCTGSGCIAITLYKELIKRRFNIDITATDISDKALTVTEKNRDLLIVKESKECQSKGSKSIEDTFHIIESDLFTNLSRDKHFDIILSNPPYIPTKDIEELEIEVRNHDPYIALDGDLDGLKFYRKIIEESKDYLKDKGFIIFEIGYNQGKDVTFLLEKKGYEDISIYKDLGGLDRVIIGRNN